LPTEPVPCAGYGYRFGADLNIISSIARNFKGRMGDPASNVYLGSPYTVAAAAGARHARRSAGAAGVEF
jgi:3-isopropylmalate/(R)-2-methylmalate dehydratase large subunit